MLCRNLFGQTCSSMLTSFVNRQILYNNNHEVIGIATNDMGISKDGSRKDNFQRGVELKGMFY